MLRLLPRMRAEQRQVNLPWGVPIAVNLSDPIGLSIWRTGLHEIAVSEVLYRLVRRGDLVLDVGAHIGYMTSLLGVCAGLTGRVLSFEPHPELFRSLEANVRLFSQHPGFAQTTLFNVALSNHEGVCTLSWSKDSTPYDGSARIGAAGPTTESISVPTRRLDDILGDRVVNVAKLDAEGHELEVLKGATKAIAEGRLSHIIYEDHIGPGSEVSGFLMGQTYTLQRLGWRVTGPVLAPLDGPSVCKSYEHPSYLATRDPEAVAAAFARRGWKIFSRANTSVE